MKLNEPQVLPDKELAWDEAIAQRMAYDLHRIIGNNIQHYRKDTQREMLAVVRAAIRRNQPATPPPAPSA